MESIKFKNNIQEQAENLKTKENNTHIQSFDTNEKKLKREQSSKDTQIKINEIREKLGLLPAIESRANSQENASELLFSRISNPKIKNQIIELLKKGEKYEAETEKDDTHIIYDENGDFIFNENGQLKVETKKIPSDYEPKTEIEIKNILEKRLNEVSLDTPISFSNEMPTGNSSEGARENIPLYFEIEPGVKLTNLQKSITEAHEKGHVIRPYEGDYFNQYFSGGFDVSEAVNYSEKELDDLKIKAAEAGISLAEGIKERSDYISDAREIAERMSQLKNYFGFKNDEEFTKDHLDYARVNYIKDTGLDNNMKSFFKGITKEKENRFIELINNSGI